MTDTLIHGKQQKKEILKDIDDCCKSLNGKVIKKWGYFNSSKGFYVYGQEALFENGETCHWSLIDGYFEDENMEG